MHTLRTVQLRKCLLAETVFGGMLALAMAGRALANPTGGTVVAGAASIASAGSTLTVTQTSNRAIVNWQGFSIANGETTRLALPSAASAILNRVTGNNPSTLAGTLSSNGQVYLINPHGVVVGPNGVINTAAFVASTLDVPDSAFMQGGSLQFSGGSSAAIVNYGTIKTSAGDVALIGLDVDNQGKIQAPVGDALLAAGSEVLYVPGGQSAVAIQPGAAPGGVTNSGVIAAASAQLRAAGSAYALAVNNGGIISATTVDQSGGTVVLDGGAGDVVSGGSIDAVGSKGAGGTVALSGCRVAVTGAVDASGATGGGQIAVAATGDIAVTDGATLRADATDAGDGGHISVKAGGATDFAGTLTATGGPNGGNGGSAEISGKTLGFTGSVDLTAAKGKTGSLLFDPSYINIVSGTSAPSSSFSSAGTTYWSYLTNTGTFGVGAGAIETALSTSNLILQATGSIDVSSLISSNSYNTLELDSPTVALNAGISLPYGILTFNGIYNGAIGTNLSSASGAAINVSNLNIDGYATTSLAGQVDAGSLTINQEGYTATSFTATNASNIFSAVTFGNPSGDSYSGSVAVSSSGNMDVGGDVNAAGGMTLVGKSLTVLPSGSGSTQFGSSGGQITLAATGGAFVNDVGTGLFSGSGRRVIYSYTNSGYNAGGLTYPTAYAAYPNDPYSSDTDVIYFAPALPLLTITANPVAMFYGGSMPTLTGTITGLVNGDTQNSLGLSFEVTTPQADFTSGGSYPIVLSGTVTNYDVNYKGANLSVVANPIVTIPTTTTMLSNNIVSTLSNNGNSVFSNGGTTINTNDSGIGKGKTVTLNLPAPIKISVASELLNFLDLGSGAEPEEVDILKTYVAAMAGSKPPLTLARIAGELSVNGPAAVPLKSQLMTLVMAQLDTILNEPQSKWTPAEAAFVKGMQNFIAQQRKAAAAKALNAYEHWKIVQEQNLQQKLSPLKGPAYAMEYAILSSNPPIPPPDFLEIAQGGSDLTNQQSVMRLALEIGNSADSAQALIDVGKIAGAQLNWLLKTVTDPKIKNSLEEDKKEISSGNETAAAIEAELSINYTYDSYPSHPSNIPGLAAGGLSDIGKVLANSMATGVLNSDSINRLLLGTFVGSKIFPHDKAGAAMRAELARLRENPSNAAEKTQEQQLETAIDDMEGTATDAAAGVEETTSSGAETATLVTKEIESVSSAVETLSSVTGPVGVAVEVVGNVVQAGVGIAEYANISSYNAQLNTAVDADNAPVTVADMQAMMSSSNGAQQMMSYIASSMAVGDSYTPDDTTNVTMQEINSTSF